MYLWYHKYLYFDYTFPYSRSIVTCLLPKPHLLPGWKTPTLPFNVNIWKSIFASLCLSAAAIYFVSKVSRKYLGDQHCRNELSLLDVFFQTWRLLVLQVPNLKREDSIHAPLRLLISWLVVLFSLLTAMYSGGLASVLTVPRFEEPIDTMYELARSGIIWAAPHEAYIYSIKDSEDYYLQEVTRNFRVLTREALVKTSLSGDKGIAVERLTAGDSHVLGSYLRFSSCALRVVGMLVLQAHVGGSEQGTPTLLRLLVTTLHFMFHTVAYIYTGGLAAVLTVPWYGPSITTLVELAASNIPWAATDDAFVWSLMDTGNPVLDKIARNFRVLKEDDLIISAEEAKLGFVMERLSGGSCSLGPHLNRKTMEKLQIMKEPLYWAHVIMVTRKSSPFIRSLNYIIQSLRESGIILFWEHDVARWYHSECLEGSVRSAGPSKLSTSNVQGAFFILYTGLLLSVVIFIFEIVVKKFKKR